MIDTCGVSDIFKFQMNQCPSYFDELFCPVGENGVIARSSNKKLKLPFRKTKLWIQSLYYVGPNTWNSLPNNLKSATDVNSFKHYIKEYFLLDGLRNQPWKEVLFHNFCITILESH